MSLSVSAASCTSRPHHKKRMIDSSHHPLFSHTRGPTECWGCRLLLHHVCVVDVDIGRALGWSFEQQQQKLYLPTYSHVGADSSRWGFFPVRVVAVENRFWLEKQILELCGEHVYIRMAKGTTLQLEIKIFDVYLGGFRRGFVGWGGGLCFCFMFSFFVRSKGVKLGNACWMIRESWFGRQWIGFPQVLRISCLPSSVEGRLSPLT